MPYSEPAFDSSPIDVHDAKELMQPVYFQFIVYYLWRKERKIYANNNDQIKCTIEVCANTVPIKAIIMDSDFVHTNNIILKRLTFLSHLTISENKPQIFIEKSMSYGFFFCFLFAKTTFGFVFIMCEKK